MTSDAWTSFVGAIRAAPDDDAPRLACADWLAARGDPRGEYVRLACERARRLASGMTAADLLARMRAIDGEARWRRPLESLGARDLVFARGFVESAHLSGPAVREIGAICRLEPITSLRLSRADGNDLRAAARAPELADLAELVLDDGSTDGVDALVASPHLTRVRRLQVTHASREMARALAASAMRPDALTLFGHPDAEVIGILSASPILDGARRLHLQRAGDDVLRALAAAPLPYLAELNLWESKVDGAGLDALGPRLDRITHLSFTAGVLGRAGTDALMRHVVSGRLRHLTLSGSRVDALPVLLASPVLTGVETLELAYGPFDRAAAEALRASPHRGRLRRLRIEGGPLRDFALGGVEVENEGL